MKKEVYEICMSVTALLLRTDRIHRARYQLRYAGSPPRHSPRSAGGVYRRRRTSAEADAAEDEVSGRREERADEMVWRND